MQITEEQIRRIAVSHQRQMASVHPHAIIETIEGAINEALVIAGVIVRSEQLKCGNNNPPCSPNIKFGCLECTECNWSE